MDQAGRHGPLNGSLAAKSVQRAAQAEKLTAVLLWSRTEVYFPFAKANKYLSVLLKFLGLAEPHPARRSLDLHVASLAPFSPGRFHRHQRFHESQTFHIIPYRCGFALQVYHFAVTRGNYPSFISIATPRSETAAMDLDIEMDDAVEVAHPPEAYTTDIIFSEEEQVRFGVEGHIKKQVLTVQSIRNLAK